MYLNFCHAPGAVDRRRFVLIRRHARQRALVNDHRAAAAPPDRNDHQHHPAVGRREPVPRRAQQVVRHAVSIIEEILPREHNRRRRHQRRQIVNRLKELAALRDLLRRQRDRERNENAERRRINHEFERIAETVSQLRVIRIRGIKQDGFEVGKTVEYRVVVKIPLRKRRVQTVDDRHERESHKQNHLRRR